MLFLYIDVLLFIYLDSKLSNFVYELKIIFYHFIFDLLANVTQWSRDIEEDLYLLTMIHLNLTQY